MMKKMIALCLACLMVFALCACDRGSSSGTTTAVNGAKVTPVPRNAVKESAASNSDAIANAQSHVPPASSTDATVEDGPEIPGDVLVNMAIAEAYVGQPVEMMYEVLGQPVEEPQYAPSCLEEDAEDGMLLYDGFYVWTVRTAEEEIIHSVGANS